MTASRRVLREAELRGEAKALVMVMVGSYAASSMM
jgi:hypothetical protein